MRRTRTTVVAGLALAFAGLPAVTGARPAGAEDACTPEQARALAKEAYVYGFPIVDSYRILHAYNVDTKSPQYKGPKNQLANVGRVFTPADTAVQTPNSDTPYSMLGFDLRAEPLVLTVPKLEAGRYFSIQFIDAYTFNFAYVGSRTTGNGGGRVLLAGPSFTGATPAGIDHVVRSETHFGLAIYRTQLFEPSDIENVRAVQAQYGVEPLSAYLKTPPPPAAAPMAWPEPLTPETQKTSLRFFELLDFALRSCPVHPSEVELRARFEKMGIGGGTPFSAEQLSPELAQAFGEGIRDAWAELEGLNKLVAERKVTSNDVFGTREHLKNNYLYRMAAAILGIYGNTAAEAMYPAYRTDGDGQPLDGSKHKYVLKFAADALPPVNAFWSTTMYELPSSLLFANPLNRYLINSPMLPKLKRDADGGVTLHVQATSPGADRESNWLPAPAGPFWVALRLYWPKAEALEGKWTPPPMRKAD